MFGYIIKTCKELFARKLNIVVFIAAVVLVGAFALTAKNSQPEAVKREPSITIGVVDNDSSIYSSFILDYFSKTEGIKNFAKISMDSQNVTEENFKNGKLLAYIVIPENFADSLMGSEDVAIDVVINTSNLMYSVLLKNMLDSYGSYISNVQVVSSGLYRIGKEEGMDHKNLNKMNWDTSIDLIKLALNRETFFEKMEVENIISTPVLQYYIWAVVTLLFLLTASLSGGRFLKERQMGTFDRLRIAGHSIRSISLVILLMNSILWICSFNLVTLGITGILKCQVPATMFVYMDLCIVLANVAFFFVSVFCRNSQQYAVICTFGLLLLSIIGGVLIPISFLPERFLVFSRMTPTYYMIENLVRYSKGARACSIIPFTGVILLLCVLIYGASCLILTKQRHERRGSYDEAVE